MTVWNKPISWSKLSSALKCHRQLQWKIDKRKPSDESGNYYRQVGILTQKVFELYFNQGLNKTEKGRTPEILGRVIQKIFNSDIFKTMEIDYPPFSEDKTEETFKAQVASDVLAGRTLMEKIGILHVAMTSEQKWRTVFRGTRTYAQIDFQYQGVDGYWIFDGKGNRNKDADPNQLLYYALSIAAAGHKIAGGGFLYWKHDYVPVDMTPAAIKRFVDEELDRAMPVLNLLKAGTNEELPATPNSQNCNFCSWKSACPDSYYKKPPIPENEPVIMQVGFAK